MTNISYHQEKQLRQTTSYIRSHSINKHPKEQIQRKRKLTNRRNARHLIDKELKNLATAYRFNQRQKGHNYLVLIMICSIMVGRDNLNIIIDKE